MSNAGPILLAATPHDAGADLLNRFGIAPVIKQDFERFVGLLTEWQRTHNLVAPSTLGEIWTRHIADSLQLITHAPAGWREWVDLGSGAGFPGLVVAIASKGADQVAKEGKERGPHPRSGGGGPPKAVEGANDGRGRYARPLHHASHGPPPPSLRDGGGASRPSFDQHVTLVESNAKKAAFLRAAIRETGVNAAVANERIEAHAKEFGRKADVVSARALASLPELLALAELYAREDTLMLFLKGREYVHELKAAAQSFDFDVIDSESATDSEGRVLAIRNVRAKEKRR